MHLHIYPERPTTTDIEAPIQKDFFPDSNLESVAIPQAQPAVFYPCFQFGVCVHDN